jgi:predicted nicotinamide N-methyase
MPGYLLKHESIAVIGVDNLHIRSLLDRQQYSDPLGAAERLGISSASWPLFGLLWPSGAHMAARLARRPVTPGERILEIGCGLALASLVGHRRGADITASDCHPLAGAFLRENLRLNALTPMKYRHGQWGAAVADSPVHDSSSHSDSHAVQGLFDLVLGSDLLYERDADGALARFIALHSAPAAQVWIVDPDRGNRNAFTRRMAQHGFALQEERLHTPASPGVLRYKGRMLIYAR